MKQSIKDFGGTIHSYKNAIFDIASNSLVTTEAVMNGLGTEAKSGIVCPLMSRHGTST